jgi:hypothetical protein
LLWRQALTHSAVGFPSSFAKYIGYSSQNKTLV